MLVLSIELRIRWLIRTIGPYSLVTIVVVGIAVLFLYPLQGSGARFRRGSGDLHLLSDRLRCDSDRST